jgi:hypothetical protein
MNSVARGVIWFAVTSLHFICNVANHWCLLVCLLLREIKSLTFKYDLVSVSQVSPNKG